MTIACYPGSFDPPTVAHLAIVDAVLAEEGIDAVHLVLSVDPLGKPGASSPADREAALRAATAGRSHVQVRTTTDRLLADVAAGYGAVVLGADKWAQIQEERWYGSAAARDAAVARLPRVLVVPRAGHPVPDGVAVLPIDPLLAAVSSSAVRAGRDEWRA